jgi:hypothetical protein
MTLTIFFGLVGLGLLAAILVKLDALNAKIDRLLAQSDRDKQ